MRISWHKMMREHALWPFEKVEDYFKMLSAALKIEDERLDSQFKEAQEKQNDDWMEWIGDDAFEFSLIRRVFHASVLLAAYQVVESNTKSLLQKDFGVKPGRGFPDWLKQLENKGFKPKAYVSYVKVDLMRILNNLFKHADGHIRYGSDFQGRRVKLTDEQRSVFSYFAIDPDKEINIAMYSIPFEEVQVGDFIREAKEFCKSLFDEADRLNPPTEPSDNLDDLMRES